MALTKVSTPAIKDEAITLAKLLHGDSNSNGKFLRANNGADPTFETVNTDLVSDTSPQLGGDLASNGNDILMGDNDEIKLGAGGDLKLEHQSSSGHSYITEVGTGNLYIQASNLILRDAGTLEHYLDGTQNGAVNLYYNGNKKFETITNGCTITGRLNVTDTVNPVQINLTDNRKIKLGDSDDLEIYFDGSNGVIDSTTANLDIQSAGAINIKPADAAGITAFNGGAVELYHNANKRFSTTNSGFALKEGTTTRLSFEYSNSLAFITANAGNEIKVSSGNGDANGIEFWDYTGVNKRCQIDGHGIKFNADTAEANALDDYEQGTYTPTFTFGGNFNGTINLANGTYTKIGRLVNVNLIIQLSNKGSHGGNAQVSLPFAVVNILAGTSVESSGFIGYFNHYNGNVSALGATAQESTSHALLRGNYQGGNSFVVTNNNFNNNTEFRLSVTYATNT